MSNPIETAPKDGTHILITGGEISCDLYSDEPLTEWVKAHYSNNENYHTETDTYEGGWVVSNTCYYSVRVDGPTHWMPLPPLIEQE